MKSVLFVLSLVAHFLAFVATVPLCPSFLVEGASPPTDVGEVRAASKLLIGTARAWLAAAAMIEFAPAPSFSVLAAALVAGTAHRVWPVLVHIAAWAGHVEGELAVYYWACIGVGCASLLILGVAGVRALAIYGIAPCAALLLGVAAGARALAHY